MSTPDWSTLEDLFHRAADLPPAERPAFLLAECPDPDLRREVESLLAHDATAGAGFQDALSREADDLAKDRTVSLSGRLIGPYRVTGIIGEGGMGAVYSAVRDDDHYHKEVAIKLVRQGFETGKVLERFRSERQILAALDHPYIARMLDGGATGEGLPYLVMELIHGEPLTDYASTVKLPLAGRLQLFLKICEAVQYAHARLIIHRDIKPANILITPSGIPKLLDFGIAKLLSETAGAEPQATGTLLLTPNYASPEQVKGQAVTTATDVYSLGAVLYELLTGRPPHALEGKSPTEAAEAICTIEPVLPSRAGGPFSRELSGDLDNILLMALRKEPARRYLSVEQFAQDIQRCLDGMPVIARADTLGYRASKFARRNRWSILAASAIFLALAAGIIASERSARRAERRFNQVRRLAGSVLFSIDEAVRPLAGSLTARQQIVRAALEYLDSLRAEAAGDPSLMNELAEAYRRVGETQGDISFSGLGQGQQAIDSYQHGIALARAAAQAGPSNADYQATLGTLLVVLSRRQFADSDNANARRSAEESVTVLERAVQRNPSRRATLETLSAAYSHLGRLIPPNDPAAGGLLEKGAGVAERLAAADPTMEHRHKLAASYSLLASSLFRNNQIEKSLSFQDRGLAIREKVVAEAPDNAEYRRGLMIAYGNRMQVAGNICLTQDSKRAVSIRPFSEKMLASAESLAAAGSNNQVARLDLAQALFRHGCLLEALHDLPGAANLYQRSLAETKNIIAAPAAPRSSLSLRSATLQAYGRLLLKQNKVNESVKILREGMDTARAFRKRDPTDGEAWNQLIGSIAALATPLARQSNRPALDALAVTLDQAAKDEPPKLAPVFRTAPAAIASLGDAYDTLHDKKAACLFWSRSAAAFQQLESSGGLHVSRKPAYANVQAHLTSCNK